MRPVSAQNPYEQVVVTDVLNGQSGPGLGYDVVVTYTEGTQLEVSPEAIEYADGYIWRLVNVKPGPVWVAEEFLEPVGDGDPDPDTLEVVDGPLNMRAPAGLAGWVLTQLPTGMVIRIDPATEIVEIDGYTWAAGWADDPDSTWRWVAMEFCRFR